MENEENYDKTNEALPVADNCALKAKMNITPGILCAVSAVLMHGILLLCEFLTFLRNTDTIHDYNLLESVALMTFSVTAVFLSSPEICGAIIIGLILLIILRVKYPEHLGGKVLMWITLAVIAIRLILFVHMIVTCGAAVDDCTSCLRAFE